MIDIVLIGVIILMINFGIGGFLYAYTGALLYSYLLKNHHKRWKSHRIIAGYPMAANPFKTFPYIFNSQDTFDKRVLFLKKRVKFWILYTLFSAIMIIVWTIIGPLIETLFK